MKRKILVFAPLFALFIAGCMPRVPLPPASGQTTTSSTSGSGPTTVTPTTTPTTTTTTTTSSTTPIDPARFGTLDNPLTMAQAHALIDEIIDYSTVEQGKSQTYTETPIFLKTQVKSNSAFNDNKEIQYLNLIDGSLEATVMYAVVDSSVTKDYSAKDSMAGFEIIVKGYGALYNKSGSKTYELLKKDNDNKPTVMKVNEPEPQPEPEKLTKTFAEIVACEPTKSQAYISSATIKSWADKNGNPSDTKREYGNLILTDGTNDVLAYNASGVPTDLVWNGARAEYVMTNSKAFLTNEITKDLEPGDVINFWGTYYDYNGKREMDIIITGKQVVDPTGVEINLTSSEVLVGGQLALNATVTPPEYHGDLHWTVTEGASYAHINDEQTALIADAAGEVTIKVEVVGYENINDTATVTVTAPQKQLISSIVSDPASLEMTVGQDANLELTILPEGYEEEVTWTITSGEDYVSLDANHTIHAEAKGTATLRIEGAESHNGCTVSISVANAPIPEPQIIDATLAEILAAPRAKNQLYRSTATIKSWATNKGAETDTKSQYGNLILTDGTNDIFVYGASGVATDLAWNSETGEYKMTNSRAFLTNEITAPLQPGDAIDFYGQIYQYGTTDEMDIIITGKHIVEPTSVTVTPSANEVFVGASITLDGTINPEGATGNILWSLQDGSEAYASIEDNVLTGLAEGTAIVIGTVEGYPNATGFAEITVKPVQKVLIQTIVADPASLELTVGNSGTVAATVTPEQVDEEISWSIKSGEGVVSLDATTHAITALKVGTAVIRIEGAESHNGCDVNVTVKSGLNYGTLENPLTVAQARTLLDTENPTSETMYVRGVVKSNSEYSTKYNNITVYITDDGETDEFQGYRVDFANDADKTTYAATNSMVGKTVVLSGTGKIHNSTTYEIDQGGTIESVASPAPSGISFKAESYTLAPEGTKDLAQEITVTPTGADYELEFTATGSDKITVSDAGVVTVAADATTTDSKTVTVTIKGTQLSASCTIAVETAPVPPTPTESYNIVTDASKLQAGDKIIITNADSTKGMKDYASGNNCKAGAITAADGVISSIGESGELVLEDAGNGRFYIKTGTNYLYAAGSSSNYLKAKADKDTSNGVWEFTYANGKMGIVAYGSSNRNVMQYNSSSDLFACYASASQVGLQVYRLETSGGQQANALPVIAQGNQATKVEGAGVWIYLDNTDLGITGANAADIIAATQATVTIEATDNTPEQYKTAFKAEPVITSMEFNDYGEGTVRLHIVLDVGYLNDWALKHTVNVTMEVGGQTYTATLTFVGGVYQAA